MIRLFFISLLWRASISGREEFKLVNIGPFEKEIKEILRTRKTKNKDNFSIMICKFDNKNLPEITNKIIQSPFNQKIDSPHSIYKCNIVDKKF